MYFSLSDYLSLTFCLSLGLTEAQALYWNKRGFRGRVYEELVCIYACA